MKPSVCECGHTIKEHKACYLRLCKGEKHCHNFECVCIKFRKKTKGKKSEKLERPKYEPRGSK